MVEILDYRNALPAGTMVQEYRLDKVLGSGGFGITYLAHDTNLESRVAIKEYLPVEYAVRALDGSIVPINTGTKYDYQWGLERFLKEARLLAKFRHPNIVQVNRYFEANGTAYMVMAYEAGESLSQRLRRKAFPPEEGLIGILLPLLDGLEAVHKAGFLHRDIKPSNIFLRINGTPLLIDFGSARLATGTVTSSMTSIVSPGYAPLEQYSKDCHQGPWTDVYSLAVWGYLMRLESVHLKVAGIGAVVTHPDHRKQGVMHRAANASFAAMLQDGYDLSILRGRHYVKMGYGRAWNYVTYRLKLQELPKVGELKVYQPLKPEQVAEMDALYNRTHADFTGTAIRPTYRLRHPEDIGVYAWYDEAGTLAGYVRAFSAEENPKQLTCQEAAGDPRQGLAVLADLFKKGEYDSLALFPLPHAHPMLQLLRRGACIVEDRYFAISGRRVKLINLSSTLHKLVPLLQTRLAQSQFSNSQESLLLDAGSQQATIAIDGGKVSIGSDRGTSHRLHGGADIARLLIGSDEPEEIMQQAGMRWDHSSIG